MDLHKLTIREFNAGLKSKKFSAGEATAEFLASIEFYDQEIQAYLEVFKEDALAEGESVDKIIASHDELPLLAGIPMAVKDVILVAGKRCTAASKILEHYYASFDADVVTRLRKQHAVFLGKVNCDEFAMGSSTENSAYQITKNPYDTERVPGGSSGGSAAAVASGMALVSLGSDTGGSIRQPASFCGICGLKPSYGAVSRHGLMALASSLDQIGPLGKCVEDVAIVFDALRGKSEYDSTSADISFSIDNIGKRKLSDYTIGVPKEYFIDGMEREVEEGVRSAIEKFKKAGAKIKEISLPHTRHALSVYYIILPAEASTNLARYDGIRYARRPEAEAAKTLKDIYLNQKSSGYGDEPTRRILLGTFVLSHGYYDAYYAKAQKVRTLIRRDFDEAFQDVDVIIAPVAPSRAFKIGEKIDDPLSLYLEDVFTLPINLAGLPSLALPVKKYSLAERELPVGFQIIGKRYREEDILNLGYQYEMIQFK